jgi:D-3-phosphoglycerate dehydrogenase
MGRLGRAIGMDVIAWTFHPTPERAAALGVRFVGLEALLRAADVVSVHVKLTPDSRGLLGARELGLMKPGAILVNTARGAIVDSAALVAALRAGRLAGAGLDVFDTEPLPADHPLLGCEQVVLTPHNADQTAEGMDILNAGVVDNVIAFLEGRPRNVVT